MDADDKARRVSLGSRLARNGVSKRETHRDYTPEQRRQLLKKALDDVVAYGISVRLAAESHGLAKSSLSDYIRRQNVQLPPARSTAAAAGAASRGGQLKQELSASPLIPGSPSPSAAATASPGPAAAPPTVESQWSLAASYLPTLVPWKLAWKAEENPPDAHAAAASLQGQSELLVGSRDAGQRQTSRLGAAEMSSAQLAATSSSCVAAASAAANLSHQLCEFINRSPSPFHTVAESRRMLDAAGFGRLCEDKPWSVQPNQRAYVTRNGSTIFAFAIGGRWQPGNGFSIIGAHTDSPCLRLKPSSCRDGAGGIQQCGVETYGGGLWYTWFDRDLTAAGKAIVRTAGGLSERLVNLEAPIFKIPSLAIHLDRTANDSFAPNKETHLAPLLCRKLLEQVAGAASPAPSPDQPAGMAARHPPALVSRVAEQLGCQPADIVDWELCLADTQPAALVGLCAEFVSAPRLDNLLSCFSALTALIEAPDLEADTNCRVVCLYDHEEVGSESAQGAGSAITEHFLRRLSAGGSFEEAVPKSMLVSADVAHAVHPNHEDKHERRHRPTLFGGVVVKTNSNQRYATSARTSALLRECLRAADPAAPPLQDFVIRQDAVCGSTIGPILSARLGLPTVDVGSPILAMHSCRETGAAVAPGQCAQLMAAFFRHFPALRETFTE